MRNERTLYAEKLPKCRMHLALPALPLLKSAPGCVQGRSAPVLCGGNTKALPGLYFFACS